MTRASRVRMAVLLVAVALPLGAIGASAASPAGQRLKTGQKKCWSTEGQVVSCAPTTQDGALRRGLMRAYMDNDDGTISDAQTGLEWEKLDDASGLHDKDAMYSWAGAFAKISALNGPPCLAGHCDWRLPNVNELQTIVDYGKKTRAVSPAFDTSCSAGCTIAACSCTAANEYWSSSSYAPNPLDAWGVSFGFGDVVNLRKTSASRVRAVRGGS